MGRMMMRGLKIIWLAAMLTGFFGASLSISGHENIFAFRVLLVLHLFAFTGYYLFWGRKNIVFNLQVKEYLWFYLAWLGWALLSAAWADSSMDAFRHIFFLLTGVMVIWFTVFYAAGEQDLKSLFYSFLGVVLIFLGASLWEHHFRYNLGFGGSGIFFERGIPNGFLGNPNDLATFLALFTPGFFCLIQYSRGILPKIIGLLAVPLSFHIILLTRSRANLLSLGLMVIVFIFFLRPWIYLKKIKIRTLLAVILILLAAFYLIILPQESWYFMEKEKLLLLKQFDSLEGSSSVSIRLVLMEKGMVMLKEHYFLGVGAGNVEYHMAPYHELTGGIVNMHNWWAEVLVNYGLPLWFFYMAFSLKMFYDLWIVFRKTERTGLKMLSQWLLISSCGFIIAVTSSSTMAASHYMWVLFAVALGVINVFKKEEHEILVNRSKNKYGEWK